MCAKACTTSLDRGWKSHSEFQRQTGSIPTQLCQAASTSWAVQQAAGGSDPARQQPLHSSRCSPNYRLAVTLPTGCIQVQCCNSCTVLDRGSLQSRAAPGLQLYQISKPQSFALCQAAHTRAYLLPGGPLVLVNRSIEADAVLNAGTLDLPRVPILEPDVWHLRLKALWSQTLQQGQSMLKGYCGSAQHQAGFQRLRPWVAKASGTPSTCSPQRMF